MDLFRDYFTRESLAGVLQKTPYVPGQLGASGLFESVGLTSTTALIEELSMESVAETAAIARGAPPSTVTLGVRKVHPFQAGTYAWRASVLADEVLNVRAAGSGAAEVIQARITEKSVKLRRMADFQHEYLRLACLNAPSNTIGTAPASAAVAFGAADTAIRTAIHNNIVKPLETALAGMSYTGIDAWCDDTFWVGLIESKTVRETYLNTAAAAALRDAPADSFNYGGITFHRYRAGGNAAIASGKAKIVPRGVSGLFVQAFAPNDTLSSVGAGAMGSPYYMDSLPIDGDKGYLLTLQTHPVMVCTRPEAILTIGLS